MSDELLTVAEAAEKLKIHQVTLRNMLRSGELKGMKFGVREWRIPDKAIQEFIDSKMRKPAAGEKVIQNPAELYVPPGS
jgi:excisionase family DNA binding protein